MNIRFELNVSTQSGERVFVYIGKAGSKKEEEYELKFVNGNWEVEIELKNTKQLIYRYEVRGDFEKWREFGVAREVTLGAVNSVALKDKFRYQNSSENVMYTSPFYKAFFSRKTSKKSKLKSNKNKNLNRVISFNLRAPRVGSNYSVGIIGDLPEMGKWSEDDVVVLDDKNYPIWSCEISLPEEVKYLEYKYVIVDSQTGRVVTWEGGENRKLLLGESLEAYDHLVCSDEYFSYPVGMWKAAGFAIPVFSIRSEHGSGVGEFSDIPKLVDWAVKTNMQIVQVLPVNDTVATHTWKDSYPYAAISVHALHPIYASMGEIGALRDKKKQKQIEEEAKRLNSLDQLDYEGVMKMKSKFFKYSFDENKLNFLNSNELNVFIGENKNWIIAYAVFSFLRDKHQTADFSLWGEHASMTDEQLEALASPDQPHYDDIAVHFYIQYHLDLQLKKATAYARERGVVLKGDIPIGIFRHSVDAWRWPHLFNMNTQTGAPPDDFSVVGQNWGFPTYNWEEMKADGYHWWVSRMKKMADYFDVFRIDHILGFFRIWEMPVDAVQGIMGHFNPSLPFSLEEIKSRGINWDYDRFCKPYISEQLLTHLFAENAEWVEQNCLDVSPSGAYILKPQFDSQSGICNELDLLIKNEPEKEGFYNSLRLSLYSLPSQVLFFESDQKPGHFDPRISLFQTSSFDSLNDYTKQRLYELHNDFFYHRHNDFWRESALDKLPMLKDATDMLICGEDLGMVPACVPGVMSELQILSLAIQRMPNDDREFWRPSDLSWMYVTSTGSHDVSNLREWWLEDRGVAQRFYNEILNFHGVAPQRCESWVAYETIRQHLNSPSMLAIFPIQDILAMNDELKRANALEERINVPAIVPHYWRYRLHINIEELLAADKFNENLGKLIDQNGRFSDY